MTLDDFVNELREKVEDFRREWKEKQVNHESVEYWPDELPEGDWYEQFVMFLGFDDS